MTRRDRRRLRALARAGNGVARPVRAPERRHAISSRFGAANRKALLLGTALASTLLLGTIAAPTPATALVTCAPNPPDVPASPGRIVLNETDEIICVNGDTRNADVAVDRAAIDLTTGIGLGNAYPIYLNNSGRLQVYGAGSGFGIRTETDNDGSTITIINDGDVSVGLLPGDAYGIYAFTRGPNSGISITNSGNLLVQGDLDSDAIYAETNGINSNIEITNTSETIIVRSTTDSGNGISADVGGLNSTIYIRNSAHIDVRVGSDADGIDAEAGNIFSAYNDITIINSGNFKIAATLDSARGIEADTYSYGSSIGIRNHGNFEVTSTFARATGIFAYTFDAFSPITVYNTGDLDVTSLNDYADGIEAVSGDRFNIFSAYSPVEVTNHGNIEVRGAEETDAIDAESYGYRSSVTVINTGHLDAVSQNGTAEGIDAYSYCCFSSVNVTNSGNITTDGRDSRGIDADSYGYTSPVSVWNSGDITVRARTFGYGIYTKTDDDNSRITVENHGDINVTGRTATGIYSNTENDNSPTTIHNTGNVRAIATGNGYAVGIYADMDGLNSPVTIRNAGSVYAEGGAYSVGIGVDGLDGVNPTRIFNTGDISAQSHLAIYVIGQGTTDIYNAGRITGYVSLPDQNDRFFNRSGGVFETKLTSFFGGGNDLFVNEAGGTVLAATDASRRETSRFQGLETFRNRGLISMIDGGAGDTFILSNTVDGTDHNFQGGGTLGVDVFLDGPTSPADVFKIEGNVSGFTTVEVNNTNFGPGTFNPDGITVIYATGATPNPNAFFLEQPVDTGFFDYDLFFEPRGSGVWELRSFIGGGAFLLPQLVTAAQDIWHQGSNTWFDRTADLRVLLAGGLAPTAYDPGGKSLGGKSLEAAGPYPLTPAVWARGSGGWLDRDDSARTTAYGRNYTFDLERELTTLDFQVGVDMGQRDVWSQGDALVFGMLGGFVYGGLDYDAIPRNFDFSGGQVGAYATYLNGGLFVDTLLNVHLYELSTATRGFPSSLDANTVGLRTDTGYRFGSFTGGAFLEPLATIEVLWADIDGFSLGGNTVRFDDDANVRGRLGLRAGTTMQAWEGTLMEPFVIGSVWGNLSDDNSATLVSNGRTFNFQDDLEDVWGEISGGVNVFNFSQTTAVFAKVDVTIGDDISGVGGKAGMRVNW